MKPDDLIGLAVMVLFTILILGNMIRSTRRLHRARPTLSESATQPRRYVMERPPVRAPERRAPSAAPPKRAAPPRRRPAPPPTLEARVLRNRRLSAGARLVVASEILSRPKALRPRRPL
jgi:hypothetical protein